VLEPRVFEPATLNGVPSPIWQMVPVVFTATGAPGPVEPFSPASLNTGSVTLTRGAPVEVRVPVPAPPPAAVPAAPPGAIDPALARVAIELAAKADPAPIPLDAAGPPVHGVMYDSFLAGALKARAALLAGTPMDAASASPALVQNDTVVLAFPLK